MSQSYLPVAINPAGMHTLPFYSKGVLAGNILHVSGQVGLPITDVEGEMWDFRAEVRQALKNVEKVVIAAGGDMSNVVKLTMYMTSRTQIGDLGAAIEEVFPGVKPATTGVIAGLLGSNSNIEIEAVAVLDPDRSGSESSCGIVAATGL